MRVDLSKHAVPCYSPTLITDQRVFRAFGDSLIAEFDCIPRNVTKNPVAVGFGNTHNAPQAWHNASPDNNWIQRTLNAAEQKVIAENAERQEQRKASEARQQAYQERKRNAAPNEKSPGSGENISVFIEQCDPVAEMLCDSLIVSTGGNQYRWHESAHDRSCDILDGTIHIFSNTMSQASPAAETEPVGTHRFYLYYLSGLDMTLSEDRPKLREFLFERGYGSDPKAFEKRKQSRYSADLNYKHNVSDIETERQGNKTSLKQWIDDTATSKDKHLFINGAARRGLVKQLYL